MVSEFVVYFELGFRHIADIRAHDHILFVVALAAGYALTHWKELLILVTAFTVGHSITLALATLRVVSISGALVEVLIPFTIIITGLFDAVEVRLRRGDDAGARDAGGRVDGGVKTPTGALSEGGPDVRRVGLPDPGKQARRMKYGLALFFGLIHGLGFSTFLRAVLGEEQSIALPLFSFNVGLEFGQILILSAILVLTWAMVRGLRVKEATWTLVLSGTVTVAALAMLVGRLTEAG